MQVTNHAKHSVITCVDTVLKDGNIGRLEDLQLPELGRMRIPSAQRVREITHALFQLRLLQLPGGRSSACMYHDADPAADDSAKQPRELPALAL